MTRNRAHHGHGGQPADVAGGSGMGMGMGIGVNNDMIALDPALAQFAPHLGGVTGGVSLPMVDPTLFEIEQVVMDVRRGRIKLEPDLQPESIESFAGPGEADVAAETVTDTLQDHVGEGGNDLAVGDGQGGMVDDLGGEIDPAFRDIVNSLTRAQDQHQQQQRHQAEQQQQQQQQQQATADSLTPAQAAALGALTDDERDKLHITLQSTLDDLAQGNYGALLQNLQDHDPSAPYLLSDPSAAGPSSLHHHHEHDPLSAPSDSHDPDDHNPAKRGRGRPKGSKNKPRPYAPPPPPKAPPPPPKPRGRPPKVRTPEEQAKLDRIMQERALGIKRAKGRPRKFPGYLVRELRLKQNRQEFNEVLRRHEDQQMHDEGLSHDAAEAEHVGGHAMEAGDGTDEQQQHDGDDVEVDYSQWDIGNGQSLLDVVGFQGVHEHDAGQPEGGDDAHAMHLGGEGDEPSADVRLGGEMRVFDLPQ